LVGEGDQNPDDQQVRNNSAQRLGTNQTKEAEE
jgi:hypothetical protein